MHNTAVENDSKEYLKKYIFARDKLLIIANKDVIKKMLLYEVEGIGNSNDMFNKYLTNLINAIRLDLKLHDKDFPLVDLKKYKK